MHIFWQPPFSSFLLARHTARCGTHHRAASGIKKMMPEISQLHFRRHPERKEEGMQAVALPLPGSRQHGLPTKAD